MIALGFVMSFSVVALLLSAITRAFDFDPNVLRTGAAILLLGFGLLMIWPAPFEWLTIRIAGLTAGGSHGNATPSQSLIGGFALGTTLGLVWTPCAGPVLGSILTLVATSKDTGWASLQLIVYAVGAAIPMLAIAYGGQAVTTRIRSIARIAPRLQQGFGVVIIAFAAASYFQYDTLIVAWLTSFYPNGQIGL
jgi:cytochrome c biogenesis protein CcdA